VTGKKKCSIIFDGHRNSSWNVSTQANSTGFFSLLESQTFHQQSKKNKNKISTFEYTSQLKTSHICVLLL